MSNTPPIITTIDFNLPAGTVVDDEYVADGVTVSATGGAGQAMIFDSANPGAGDPQLGSSTLEGILISSEDGDSSMPDAGSGTLTFSFTNLVQMKMLTFKSVEEGTTMTFYAADGSVIETHHVDVTAPGGENTVLLNVPEVAVCEVFMPGPGAIDNLMFIDSGIPVAPMVGDGIVSGTDGADVIDIAYTGDPEGDMIDNGDAVLAGEAPEDDIVDALGGDDLIQSGLGDDDVYAGGGDDTVEGGAGNDIIYGDSTLADSGDTMRESFEWDLAADPDGPGAGAIDDGDDLSGSFTQNTGTVDVTYQIVPGAGAIETTFSSDEQLVDGIDTGSETADANSSLESATSGENQTITYKLAFSDPVENVDFRINDIDGDGVVRIFAYDADSNPIEVILTGGSNLTLSDTDGLPGNESATSNGGTFADTASESSLQVSIPGPVKFVSILHSQNGADASEINVTDVYFDSVVTGLGDVAGNDMLSGNDGDDIIFGEGGNDTLDGGAGADTLSGGADADTFIGGNVGDVVDGGTDGDDNDTLDLSGSGPLRVLSETTDADGDSTSGTIGFLDADGNVDGTMTFAEIENLILPPATNGDPVANPDVLEVDEDTPGTVNVLLNDTDPDGDTLTVTDASSPDGTVTFDPTGDVTFTPNPDFNGSTTITYTADDGAGGTATGTVNVTVNPVNDAPTANDDTASTAFETPVTIPVLANDTDPEGGDLIVTEATSPNGDVVINPDGTVTFTPADGFSGEATITYTAADPGGLTDSGTATVTVSADTRDGYVDGNADGNLIDAAYSGDPDGDMIDANDEILPGAGPNDDYVRAGGGDDTVFAGEGDDIVEGGAGDDQIDGGVGNDTLDGGAGADTLSGGADADTFIGGNVGDVVDGGTDGDDNDTLDLSGSGPLRVLSETTDADGDSTSGTIGFLDADGNVDGTMTFAEIENLILPPATNGDPVANPDVLEVDEDTPGTVNVLLNDTDPDGDTLTVTDASSPDGTVTFDPTGDVTFTPNPDFNGSTTITYTADDGAGGTATGTVNVTVNPVNDAPTANDDTASTSFETPVTIPVLANDTDPEGGTLIVTEATSPNGDVVINPDGTVTFTPADGFSGEATITYTAADPGGLTDSGTATVTVSADTRDGYVDGNADGNLIDAAYTGDPDGDMIDANDEILPGAGPNDDYVRAGGGDDTVFAGEGDDIIEGGAGDDQVDGGVGNDTVMGGAGSDSVLGGAGDDDINTDNGDLAPDLGYPTATTDPLGYPADSDPENDRDLVDGGAGNDTIRTGDDRDTIIGGDGNDVINAGIDDDQVDGGADDDRIVGGEGNDNILGGAGNDTIFAGNDPDLGLDALDIPDEPVAGNIFTPDRRPDNGRDTVDGGAGNDVIYGADDDDLLRGGSGDDYIDGQIDDDTLIGGSGEDTLVGGQGDDSLSGGTENDTLMGGTGDDTLRGNRDDDLLDGGDGDDRLDGGGENDTLLGGAGNDTLGGSQGNDMLDGGDGDDRLDGGQGDDTLNSGAGIDTMFGGNDQDTFLGVNAGDQVDGGSGGVDFDTLDLRGSAPAGGRLEVTYTSEDREDGFVTYYDASGETLKTTNAAGEEVDLTLDFEEIENIVPCFTPGTRIATPKGERLVEDLQVGDRVITRDNGIQEIRWVGARNMTGAEFDRAEHLKPVLIREGALGNGLPERDMMVSPNHRVLVANDKTALYFEEREVLVAAKHLTGLEGVDIVDVSHTTYIHVMFDQHEVILSDGAWTESFQPGDQTLAGIGNAQRNEILELFPELATPAGIEGYQAARRSLKKHEAKLLTK